MCGLVLTLGNLKHHLLKVHYLKEITPVIPPAHIVLPPSYNQNHHQAMANGDPSSEKSTATNSNIHTKPNFAIAPIIPISLDKLQQREAAAIKAEQMKQARMGVNVSEEGQNIFDALIKTMNCRWKNDAIVVLDDVLIPAPYKVDSCRFLEGKKHDHELLSRVKKVLDGERRRLGLVP